MFTKNAIQVWTVTFTLVVLLLPQTTFAQNQSENDQAVSFRSKLNLNFKGGTVSEFVQKLKISAPSNVTPLNIVVTEHASNILLPPIELTQTTPTAALDLINVITSRQHNPLKAEETGNGSLSGWVVDVEVPDESPTVQKTVINATNALTSFDTDSAEQSYKMLLDTINTGMEFHGSTDNLKIQFHQETGLLFVHGRQDSIEFLRQIIGELEKNSASNPMHSLLQGMMGDGGGGGGGMMGGLMNNLGGVSNTGDPLGVGEESGATDGSGRTQGGSKKRPNGSRKK